MRNNLIDIYSKHKDDLDNYNEYNKKKITASAVCRQIKDIKSIVKSNYRLFHGFIESSKTKEIELTKIVNEELSYNGPVVIDASGYLHIHLNEHLFNKKDKVSLSVKKNYDGNYSVYYLRMINKNKEFDLKGFFTDTPEGLIENFCEKIKPIYKELIANMSGKPENIK